MGGSVCLKGTEGEAIVDDALRRGARPIAGERAAKAIAWLIASLPQEKVLTVSGHQACRETEATLTL